MSWGILSSINPFSRSPLITVDDEESQMNVGEMEAMPIMELEDGSFRQITVREEEQPSRIGALWQKCVSLFSSTPDDQYGIVPFMRKMPLSDIAMAVFAKCDLNKAKPEIRLIDFINRRRGVVLSPEEAKSVKTKAKIVSTIIQGVAAACLMNPNFF